MRPLRRGQGAAGFSLLEIIVVIAILSLVMVGLLGMFDSGARLNKTETDVSDMQQSLRYAAYQLTRNIRMAGAGLLPIAQSVLVRDAWDATLTYDNVAAGQTVTNTAGIAHPVRPGTDMIEIRGVIATPLFAIGPPGGCSDGACQGVATIVTIPGTTTYNLTNNLNNQFTVVRQYGNANLNPPPNTPLLMIVASSGFNAPAGTLNQYTTHLYNVGYVDTSAAPGPGGWWNMNGANLEVRCDFTRDFARAFDGPAPTAPGTAPAAARVDNTIRAGILDDYLYFIDNSDPSHPSLSVGRLVLQNGAAEVYDISAVADDIEDMQIAYGVDLNGNNAIGLPVGAAAGDDEWLGNLDGEAPPTLAQIQGTPAAIGPHAIMISLVAKATNADVAVLGRPGSLGIKTMNSTAGPISTTSPYNRRLLTWRINLRNFAYQGT